MSSNLPLVIEMAENLSRDTNAVELAQLSQAWQDLAIQLGYVCLAIGFVFGLIAGYFYAKGKYCDGSGE
jgi:hypothetical protein